MRTHDDRSLAPREPNRDRRELRRSALVGAALGASMTVAFFAVTSASADGLPGTESVPRVIPFAGELALDGQAYSGVVDLRVSLYDAPGATTARWSETHDAVPVAGGQFSVLLGKTGVSASDGLRAVIADASPVFVGVEVKPDLAPATSFVALSGKQLLGPSPYALWAPQAASMNVAGALTVAGATTAASLAGTGDVYVDKPSATVVLGQPGTAARSLALGDDVASEGAQLVYQPTSDELSIQKGQSGTGAKQLTIQGATGALALAGGATLGGAVSLDGDLALGSGAALTLAGGYIRLGPGAKGRKGVLFGSSTASKGMKMVFDAGDKVLSFEGGQAATNDGDIMTIAQDSLAVTVHGDLTVGGSLIVAGAAVWSSATNIENGADKSYSEDATCTVGTVMGISTGGGADCDNDTPEAGICVCAAPAGKSKGWFCWH